MRKNIFLSGILAFIVCTALPINVSAASFITEEDCRLFTKKEVLQDLTKEEVRAITKKWDPISVLKKFRRGGEIIGGASLIAGACAGLGVVGAFDSAYQYLRSIHAVEVRDKAGLKVSPVAQELNAPGNCGENEHKRLQEEIRNYCDRPRKCNKNMNPTVLKENIERNRACGNAREKINKKCFAGGNVTHRNEAIAVWELLAKCEGFL